MSAIQLNKNCEETSFSKPIKRALLRDKRLSFYARGLFAMLWDFPKDWVFYKSYLVAMSPEGKFKLERHIKELKCFGALTIEPRQLSAAEATERARTNDKSYRAGQFVGFKWTLNHPDLWAIEAPLSNKHDMSNVKIKPSPKTQFTEFRQNRPSVKPTFGKLTTKGLPLEGSANIRPLPQNNEVAKNPSGSTDYIFPKQLTSQEREIAKPQLDVIDSALAQAVLDELAARLNVNKIKGAPLSYLRSLIARAKTGQFTPEAGIRVASARERAKQEQFKKAAEVLKPSNPSEVPKHLAAMHQVLARKSTSNLNSED
jgi:hypothetical protein